MDLSNVPVIAPILALLHSRKFLVSLAGIIVNLVIIKLPELAPARDIFMAVVTATVLGLVGTIAWEDRASAARTAAAEFDAKDLQTLIREVVTEVVDAAVTGKVPADAQG